MTEAPPSQPSHPPPHTKVGLRQSKSFPHTRNSGRLGSSSHGMCPPYGMESCLKAARTTLLSRTLLLLSAPRVRCSVPPPPIPTHALLSQGAQFRTMREGLCERLAPGIQQGSIVAEHRTSGTAERLPAAAHVVRYTLCSLSTIQARIDGALPAPWRHRQL